MNIAVTELIDRVKVCIDEIALNDAEFVSGQDNMEMDTIIRSKITEAIRYILSNADWGLLEPDAVMTQGTEGSGFTIDENLVGRIPLPGNFLRVCYARFLSWKSFPTGVIYWNDSEYATLADEYATGTWERPKLAIVRNPGLVLEMYSAKTANDGWVVAYVTEPDTPGISEDDAKVDIPDKLLEPTIYYIAGLTLLTYKDSHADSMFNQALVLAGMQGGTR